MIAIGIDIGLTGAIAAVSNTGRCDVRDMPTVPDGDRRRIHGKELIRLVRVMLPADQAGILVFEDVRPRPLGNHGRHGNTMHSQASMMRSRGIVEAVADIVGLEVKVVQPQTWKRYFGLIGKDKEASRETAQRLHPNAAPDLKRVKDHNRADAILLAHYALRSAE